MGIDGGAKVSSMATINVVPLIDILLVLVIIFMVITPLAPGRPRGFGFVAMSSVAEATQAIGALNGSLVEGRAITVRTASPRLARST